MRKQLLSGLMLVIVLATVIALRVRAQNAYKHAPSGGSSTLEGTEAVVATKQGGRLVGVLAREGDAVKAGQVLARLDCDDQEATLALAKARARQAVAQVELAESGVGGARETAMAAAAQVHVASARAGSLDVQRQKATRDRERANTLAAAGAAPSVDLDRAETAEKGLAAETQAAQATIDAARSAAKAQASTVGTAGAQVAVARAALDASNADVRRLELAVAECVLKAPRDGVVVDRLHEPGAVIGPGTRVLTLIDISTIKATFFLPNAELSRAKLGARAEVRVDAYPSRVFVGTVRHVGSEAEFTPRNVQTREDRDRLVYAVEVALENPDGDLRSGMPGEVVLPGTNP